MHVSSRNTKIIAAVVIAVVMVSVSFWFTSTTTRIASALSTDELLRAYVEQDTDDDGLPDWQEEVYGTDPGNPYSVSEDMTDLEALREGLVKPAYESEDLSREVVSAPSIPGEEPAVGSLTEQFSRQFAEAYFAAGGGTNVSEVEQQRIINDLFAVYVRQAEKLLVSSYTLISVRIDRNSSFDEYIVALADILIRNDVPSADANPLLLTEALMQGDDDAPEKLAVLSTVYETIKEELLMLSVPAEAADAHLALLREFDTFARATHLVQEYDTDPIAALGALSVYESSSTSIATATRTLASLILREGEPEPGTAAAMIVRIARNSERP